MLNAAEAEIVSLSSAAQECLFLRKLCIEMGFHQHRPTIIYEDCEAAVALSKETRFRKRSKHIALRWHFIAERQDPTSCCPNICENAWNHHSSLRISGSGAQCLSHSI